MERFDINKGGVILKWTLDNFCFQDDDGGTFAEFPTFRMEVFTRILWSVAFEKRPTGELDLKLKRICEKEITHMHFSLFLLDKGTHFLHVQGERLFEEADKFKFLYNFHIDESKIIIAKQSVLVLCHLWTNESNLKERTVICNARTYMEGNKLQLEWKIKNFSRLSRGPRQIYILPEVWELCPPFKLLMRVPKRNCTIADVRFDIVSFTELRDCTPMILKISIANSVKKEFATAEGYFLFGDGAAKWPFPEFQNENQTPIRELLPDDVLVVNFDLNISTGETFQYIEGSQILEIEPPMF